MNNMHQANTSNNLTNLVGTEEVYSRPLKQQKVNQPSQISSRGLTPSYGYNQAVGNQLGFNAVNYHPNREVTENNSHDVSFQVNDFIHQNPQRFTFHPTQFQGFINSPYSYEFNNYGMNNHYHPFPVNPNTAPQIQNPVKTLPSNPQQRVSLPRQFDKQASNNPKNTFTIITPEDLSLTIRQDIISLLPEDISSEIFKFFEQSDHATTVRVSKKWNAVSMNSLICWFNRNQEIPTQVKLSNVGLLNIFKEHGSILQFLNLGQRKLDNNQMDELIEYCPNLRNFSFHSTTITNVFLNHLTQLSSLQTLDLYWNSKMNIKDLDLIAQLTTLHTLRIHSSSSNGTNDVAPLRLARLTELQGLCLEGKCMTNIGLARISAFTALKTLKLSLKDITNTSLLHFSRLTNLTELGLSGSCSKIENFANVSFPSLPLLKKLNIPSFLGPAHLSQLIALQELSLYTDDNAPFSDNDFALVSSLTNLQILHLPLSSHQLTDGGLIHLLPLTNLQELKLFHPKFTRTGIAHISQLPALRKLSFGYVENMMSNLQYLCWTEIFNNLGWNQVRPSEGWKEQDNTNFIR